MDGWDWYEKSPNKSPNLIAIASLHDKKGTIQNYEGRQIKGNPVRGEVSTWKKYVCRHISKYIVEEGACDFSIPQKQEKWLSKIENFSILERQEDKPFKITKFTTLERAWKCFSKMVKMINKKC